MMDKIRRGKIIQSVSFAIGILIWIIYEVANQIYKKNVIQNLQGYEKMEYEMGINKTLTLGYDVIILLIAFSVIIIGGIIGSIMCKCPNCGHFVMTRYGSIHKHCPNCGKKIVY